MKLNKLCVFLFMIAICISCSKTEKNKDNNIKNEIKLNMGLEINENYKKNVAEYSVKENNFTDFFFNEIMNGNKDLSFRHGEDKIIEYFGNPIEIIVQPTSFYFEGGTVIELHEFVYDDFIHYYYVFENGKKLYNGFVIEKELDRLKTINIGDTSEKLLSTFSDEYYLRGKLESTEENIIYYTDPVECEIQFVIKDAIIQKIFVNFLLI